MVFIFVLILQPLPPSGMGSGQNITWGMMRGDLTGEKEDKCGRECLRTERCSSECVCVCVCATTTQCVCECKCGEQSTEGLQPVKDFAVGPFARVVNQEELAS
jgi:hypothetical protein